VTHRDVVNELQAAVDADYYRRTVQFTEDTFVFAGPQKMGTLIRNMSWIGDSVIK